MTSAAEYPRRSVDLSVIALSDTQYARAVAIDSVEAHFRTPAESWVEVQVRGRTRSLEVCKRSEPEEADAYAIRLLALMATTPEQHQ